MRGGLIATTPAIMLILAGGILWNANASSLGVPSLPNYSPLHTGTAECPIKKTIDGKTYYFQNDPALTKRQGGG
jgi:hypothetical protein